MRIGHCLQAVVSETLKACLGPQQNAKLASLRETVLKIITRTAVTSQEPEHHPSRSIVVAWARLSHNRELYDWCFGFISLEARVGCKADSGSNVTTLVGLQWSCKLLGQGGKESIFSEADKKSKAPGFKTSLLLCFFVLHHATDVQLLLTRHSSNMVMSLASEFSYLSTLLCLPAAVTFVKPFALLEKRTTTETLQCPDKNRAT